MRKEVRRILELPRGCSRAVEGMLMMVSRRVLAQLDDTELGAFDSTGVVPAWCTKPLLDGIFENPLDAVVIDRGGAAPAAPAPAAAAALPWRRAERRAFARWMTTRDARAVVEPAARDMAAALLQDTQPVSMRACRKKAAWKIWRAKSHELRYAMVVEHG